MQNEMKKYLRIFQFGPITLEFGRVSNPTEEEDRAFNEEVKARDPELGAFFENAVSEEDLDDGEGPDHAQH